MKRILIICFFCIAMIENASSHDIAYLFRSGLYVTVPYSISITGAQSSLALSTNYVYGSKITVSGGLDYYISQRVDISPRLIPFFGVGIMSGLQLQYGINGVYRFRSDMGIPFISSDDSHPDFLFTIIIQNDSRLSSHNGYMFGIGIGMYIL